MSIRNLCTACQSVKFRGGIKPRMGTFPCNDEVSYFSGPLPKDWSVIRDKSGEFGYPGDLHYICPKCQRIAHRRGIVLNRERV